MISSRAIEAKRVEAVAGAAKTIVDEVAYTDQAAAIDKDGNEIDPRSSDAVAWSAIGAIIKAIWEMQLTQGRANPTRAAILKDALETTSAKATGKLDSLSHVDALIALR